MTLIRRPFLVTDRSDEIGEIRNRADRLQRRCTELASELAELLDQTLGLAADVPAKSLPPCFRCRSAQRSWGCPGQWCSH